MYSISYSRRGRGRGAAPIRNVTLELHAGESLALIGESGSGKTTLGLGIVRLLPDTAKLTGPVITYRRDGPRGGCAEAQASTRLREFRWSECAMVFQAALNAFNPVLKRVGRRRGIRPMHTAGTTRLAVRKPAGRTAASLSSSTRTV
jgi:peptide/nickel transport system ATP-binding protein